MNARISYINYSDMFILFYFVLFGFILFYIFKLRLSQVVMSKCFLNSE